MDDPIRRSAVARILGCSVQSVVKAMKRGDLPPCSPIIPGGKHLYWEKADIVRLRHLKRMTMEEFNKEY